MFFRKSTSGPDSGHSAEIFINYRRGDDSSSALLLYERLKQEFTADNLSMDIEGLIKPGDDFVAKLNSAVAACDVLLAVIGPRWAERLAERAGDSTDFVVIEIAAALSQGKSLIPVLVGGATMPKELPRHIEKLAHIHAAHLRHESYNGDYQVLLRILRERLASVERARAERIAAERAAAEAEGRRRAAEEAEKEERAEAQATTARSSKPRLPPTGMVLGLGLAILFGVLAYWWLLAAPAPVPTPAPKGASKINPDAQPKKSKQDHTQREAKDTEQKVVVLEPPPASAPKVELTAPAARDTALSVRPGSGESFRDTLADGQPCSYCPEMVVVPAGSFMMGWSVTEIAALKKEDPKHSYWETDYPQHRVTIERPFAVGKYEVTFAEWDACAAEGGCSPQVGVRGKHPWDACVAEGGCGPKGRDRGKHPVVDVTWKEITGKYLPWLSRKTGKSYRLLTEAEWEYAARAGTRTPRWWGSSISTTQANYGRSWEKYWYWAMPVDSFAPNPWGLYNVHGNVSEWVEDCWNSSYNGVPSDGTAWTTGNCNDRVSRGGNFINPPSLVVTAIRARLSLNEGRVQVGFRVARIVDP